MSSFTTPPAMQPLGDGKFKLLEDFCFYYAVGENKTDKIVYKKGEITDFASTPKIVHGILGPTDKHLCKPSLVHDPLYGKTNFINPITKKTYTRRESDLFMFYAMIVVGAPDWKLFSVYIALRLFGWKGYNYAFKNQEPPLVRKIFDKLIILHSNLFI